MEDVAFKPGSAGEVASVGDDHALMLWDARNPAAPAASVPDAHGAHDLHCIAWSAVQDHMLASGGHLAKGLVQILPALPLACASPLQWDPWIVMVRSALC